MTYVQSRSSYPRYGRHIANSQLWTETPHSARFKSIHKNSFLIEKVVAGHCGIAPIAYLLRQHISSLWLVYSTISSGNSNTPDRPANNNPHKRSVAYRCYRLGRMFEWYYDKVSSLEVECSYPGTVAASQPLLFGILKGNLT